MCSWTWLGDSTLGNLCLLDQVRCMGTMLDAGLGFLRDGEVQRTAAAGNAVAAIPP